MRRGLVMSLPEVLLSFLFKDSNLIVYGPTQVKSISQVSTGKGPIGNGSCLVSPVPGPCEKSTRLQSCQIAKRAQAASSPHRGGQGLAHLIEGDRG